MTPRRRRSAKTNPQLPIELITTILTLALTEGWTLYKSSATDKDVYGYAYRHEYHRFLKTVQNSARRSKPKKLRVQNGDYASTTSFPHTAFALALVSKSFFYVTLRILEKLDPDVATHPNVKALPSKEDLTPHQEKCDGLQKYAGPSVEGTGKARWRLCGRCEKGDRRVYEQVEQLWSLARVVEVLPEGVLVKVVKRLRLAGRRAALDEKGFAQRVAEEEAAADADA